MKTVGVNRIIILLFLMLGWTVGNGQQNQPEVPGDDFSLEGALELFKKSTSPEEFERMLNSPDSKVNNLDLNGDGDTDYIKVIDRNEGNIHAFILQAVVSETESQDVAVIELEKLDNGKAVLQITGDADIYGVETIIEPTDEVRINAGTSTMRTNINVWAWPSVQYVYSPYYSAWMSPWGWNSRPVWWSAWRPVPYYVYNPWWQPYRSYYSYCNYHRISYAQQMYRPYRSTSIIVYNRHNDQLAHYRSSHRETGYTRGRDNDHHNGRQGNDGYHRSATDGNRSYDTQGNSGRSSGNDWVQHQGNGQRRSIWRNQSSSSERSSNGFNRSTPQRDWSSLQRHDSRGTSGLSNNNPVWQQRGNRSSSDTRGSQRTFSQPERRSTSIPNFQRSGNEAGGHSRGRH